MSNTQSNTFTYIIPVYGVCLTKAVKFEFRIRRVTLITQEKLARTRKRFGLYDRLSNLKKDEYFAEIFSTDAPCYAVIKDNDSNHNKIKKIVEEELQILSLSQLGYAKRKSLAAPSINLKKLTHHTVGAVGKDKKSGKSVSVKLVGRTRDLVLNARWKNYQQKSFFFTLLQILRSEIKLQGKWISTLAKVSKLIGKSQNSDDKTVAFILNVIALETLLTKADDKYSDALPKRVEAFIGWVGYWDTDDFSNRIKEIYSKRCIFVHTGDDTDISLYDLIFSDDILLNTLRNIIKHHQIFKNKETIIEFSEKIKAEHTLGIVGRKSRVRPKTLSFTHRIYSEKDFEDE